MHKILLATIAGLLVTFQPAHAANHATDAASANQFQYFITLVVDRPRHHGDS